MPDKRPPASPEHDEDVLVEERPRTRAPRRYRVLLHNDDFTPMDFVVRLLTQFFRKSETDATRIMLEVHHRGVGVAGSYSRDVAETKVAQADGMARAEGHPLRLTAEPE